MQASVSSESQSDLPESTPRLRTDILDKRMREKGVDSVTAQARAFGLNVTHWFDIRSGRAPNITLKTAMRIAAESDSTVDELWDRAA